MSGTIQYEDGGSAKEPESATSAEQPKGYSEGNDEHVPDPTAMSGTLETSETSGDNQSADSVSEVFDVADHVNAENDIPEGLAQAPGVDPAAEGEDALTPDYSGVEVEGEGSPNPKMAKNPNADLARTDDTAPVYTGTTDTSDAGAPLPGDEPLSETEKEQAAENEADHSQEDPAAESPEVQQGGEQDPDLNTEKVGESTGVERTAVEGDTLSNDGAENGDDKPPYDLRRNLDDYSVAEVLEYKAKASDSQWAKVVEKEKSGKGRKGIIEA